jgi:hypothetical protein
MGMLSEWIIDELEKLCYYTADFEDIDDAINNEDFNLICCAAEEVDDLHHRFSELICQRILDSSVSHDDIDVAVVVQHQSTEDSGVDFLRDLPEVVLQELFDYYYFNRDSNSNTSSTTTYAVATEREEAIAEPVQDTVQPVVFLDNTYTVDHKSISLHHASDKSSAVKSSTTGTVLFASLPNHATYNILIRTPLSPKREKCYL